MYFPSLTLIKVTAFTGLLFLSKVRCPVIPSKSVFLIASTNSLLSTELADSIADFKTYTVS